MPEPAEKTGKSRPARLDMVDVYSLAGLVFVLLGLGLEVGWGWGMAADGLIMLLMVIWMTLPPAKGAGK